ncbi:hypothetical protein GCM10027037_02680 [Mucilaginibacter koreensis]
MTFNQSTKLPDGNAYPTIQLRCGNLRTAFLAFDMSFWLFTLIFLCQMAMHSVNPILAARARAVNDFFGSSAERMMIGPVFIAATLLFFAWGRKKISWTDGLRINDKPVTVTHYQFKAIMAGMHLFYLQSGSRLWVVYPVTSQDGRKFPDAKIMERERAVNEAQEELLLTQLAASGAIEKSFWFFTKDVVISFAIFITIVIIAFTAT